MFIGAGRAGFVFRLDDPQPAAAQAFFDGANYIGLGVSGSEGGFEHSFLAAGEAIFRVRSRSGLLPAAAQGFVDGDQVRGDGPAALRDGVL
jgi:hypothetical protein